MKGRGGEEERLQKGREGGRVGEGGRRKMLRDGEEKENGCL